MVSGESRPIFSDFRNVLQFFDLQRDEKVMERHKAALALRLFFKEPPADAAEAFAALAWYINCGRDIPPRRPRRPDFDFSHDAGLIFSSFWEQYGLDLSEARLHWWKFSALFMGLGENTSFRQVVSLRNRKEDGLDNKARAELREAKKAWELPAYLFTDKRDSDLERALLSGNADAIKKVLK